ncbi:hypothetical protein B5X24_HaOG214172 [Helicoverpa armigera]|uniref:Uncharacterized protein n=1 Tax=Helicoverpa armigera TaxID=29058 RepID=A0A2W1BAX5_HELAM|nr:hypothetical protein B5X24_HaOG214172 [Helicoverpa armigera]
MAAAGMRGVNLSASQKDTVLNQGRTRVVAAADCVDDDTAVPRQVIPGLCGSPCPPGRPYSGTSNTSKRGLLATKYCECGPAGATCMTLSCWTASGAWVQREGVFFPPSLTASQREATASTLVPDHGLNQGRAPKVADAYCRHELLTPGQGTAPPYAPPYPPV